MSNSGFSSPSASPSRILSKDIADVCIPIKDQLEAMQVRYGEESILNLVAPVLTALEELERYKLLYDEEHQKCDDYQSYVEKLEKELKQKHDEKMRLQQDYAMLEASSQEEYRNALDVIQKLEKDNKRLQQRANSAIEIAQEAQQAEIAPSSVTDEEAQIMVDLRKKYTKEHELVRDLQEQLAIEKEHVEDLRGNIEKLYSQNKELLRKNKSLVAQGKVLITERSELSRKFEHVNKEYIKTKHALTQANMACQDLESETLTSRSGSDVPKFTEKELQDVFMSKVKLIDRITELEMQLERMKASSPTESERLDEVMSRPSSTASALSQKSSSNEECLVYGPINKEPDEKLYPWKYEKKDSGVRKFFSSIFKNVNNSPRRGSTALGPQ